MVDSFQIEQERTGSIPYDTAKKKLKGLLEDNETLVEKAQEIGEALPQEGATKVMKNFAERVGEDLDQSESQEEGKGQEKGKGQDKGKSQDRGSWSRR
ncbi:hypothetical protein [Salinibacter altiplanensis]|uniref:hypothetical protein n=1 Tax=Salinibacter altiplanensis TaxID=1803181 RepID=UPI001F1F3E7A|nr:hypothetical protein [Salinibacter altiplanensis]